MLSEKENLGDRDNKVQINKKNMFKRWLLKFQMIVEVLKGGNI